MHTFPYFRQLESMDCGPACLKMICMFYGKDYSIEEIRKLTNFNSNGVTMLDLSVAAESIGFSTLSVTYTLDELIKKTIFPCIIYFYSHHFVVVYHVSFKKGKTLIHVADPAGKLTTYPLEEFQKGWLRNTFTKEPTGTLLMLESK